MVEITKIKAQRNKKRVNIYLDGKFAFPLPTETLVKAGLKVGQEITEEEIEILRYKDIKSKLHEKALNFLSYRPRSENEIRDYLNKKLQTPFRRNLAQRAKRERSKNAKLVEEIIKKLKKQKLIDDQEFVRWWIEQRSTFRPRGKMALRMELAQKGIDRELAEKVINEMVDELVLAKKAAQKKMKAYRRLDYRQFREKMSAFLSRRGFSWEVIKTVIDYLEKKR